MIAKRKNRIFLFLTNAIFRNTSAKYCFCLKILGLFLAFLKISEGHAQSALLAEGSWYRISVFDNGIYQIRYNDLRTKGVLENPVLSSHIALFGGENGMLSELNQRDDTFDLKEISIFVQDGGDGEFGENDYILFYGQSPNQWKWNQSLKKHEHNTNVYTRFMSYFFNFNCSGNNRKRVTLKEKETATPTVLITDFTDHYIYENDRENPFSSSREWYGEKMTPMASKADINLVLQGLIVSQEVDLKMRLVFNESATVDIQSELNQMSMSLNKLGSQWMYERTQEFSWKFSNSRPLLSFRYASSSGNTSWAYLDFLEVHYRRELSLENAQMHFRYTDEITSETGEFRISSVSSTSSFWDVSNPLCPQIVQGDFSNNLFSFRASLSEISEFIGFSENTTQIISQFEKVENQNLHGIDSVQYIIVVHPDFLKEAERLAKFHEKRNLKVLITTPNEVFNEFSYGRQDPISIRRMLRYFRNKAKNKYPDILPEYLLLFGAPSYDYLDRKNEVQNFVLNYQFPKGLREGESFSTDDMFGFLDDGETGWGSANDLDIGIGRFPVRTEEQAKTIVNKTITYAENRKLSDSTANFSDWRNTITFLSDDDAGFVQAYETYLVPDLNDKFKEFNVEKIYSDAYLQVATPSGARYPEVKNVLKQRIERGSLILNYEGHSGETSFADENLVNLSDIASYANIDQLTFLFAASCSFSRYDNPSVISGGEQIVLSPNGGAVASVGASRVAYISPNDAFHGAFSRFVLQRQNGNAQTLGEAMRLAKNQLKNSDLLKSFVLLGDPAISLALPKYKVVTTHINGESTEGVAKDTVKALENISIAGKITDFQDVDMHEFNGSIVVTVYDKSVQMQTLGQKNSTSASYNPIISYETQKNILFKGKTSVVNGEFSVQFTTPKDINYAFGFGKISYYAFSDSADATGVFDSVIIGGFGEDFGTVADAPVAELFMNDSNFIDGNITTQNPILLAKISDKYGINYSGAGIGHNISLILDDDYRNQIYLNDYFEYLSGNSTVGEVHYPLYDLSVGKHNLKLKVWNIFNVSTVASLDFEVVEATVPYIANAYCYPNPIRDQHTHFYFTHNVPKKIKRTEIDILDIQGRLITRLSKSIFSEGFAVEPMEWDATDSRGNRLRQGLYLYRIRIVCEDGYTAERTEKLIIDG